MKIFYREEAPTCRGSPVLSIKQREFEIGFGDDLTVDEATAGGLTDVATYFGGGGFGDESVARHDGFAPFDIIGGEEVANFSEVLRFAKHEDGGNLSHTFELENAGHDGMVREVTLEKWDITVPADDFTYQTEILERE